MSLKDACRCRSCKQGSLELWEDERHRYGLYSCLYLECSSCVAIFPLPTSSLRHTRGKSYEVNRRAVFATTTIGVTHEMLARFCALMNMPPPPHNDSFLQHMHDINLHAQSASLESMKSAGRGIHLFHEFHNEEDPGETLNSSVSVDGSWAKRGFSSLYGIVTAISIDTGQILDAEVLVKYCKVCQYWEKYKGSVEYNRRMEEHRDECPINYEGSAASMEPAGALALFTRSIERHNLRYTRMVSDGDSKSFTEVSAAKPYGDEFPVEKEECIGHVQKRMGTALRKFRTTFKLKDGSPVGGRGGLTIKLCDKLQNLYGRALRENLPVVDKMKTAVMAILHHEVQNRNLHEMHKYCPVGPNSYCQYQVDKATGSSLYDPTKYLPRKFFQPLKPIFNRLSHEDLLKRTTRGLTQNPNESFHSVLWQHAPKNRPKGPIMVTLAANLSICQFNDGMKYLADLTASMGLIPGRYLERYIQVRGQERIRHAERQASTEFRKRRKQLRRICKGFEDEHQRKEGKTYEAGGF